VIDGFDLSAMVKSYRGSGSAGYHPALLLGLLVYGYTTGVFSSRKLERATYDSVAFRFIAANDHPDQELAQRLAKMCWGVRHYFRRFGASRAGARQAPYGHELARIRRAACRIQEGICRLSEAKQRGRHAPCSAVAAPHALAVIGDRLPPGVGESLAAAC
jgi:Transposase domain (DUF772)